MACNTTPIGTNSTISKNGFIYILAWHHASDRMNLMVWFWYISLRQLGNNQLLLNPTMNSSAKWWLQWQVPKDLTLTISPQRVRQSWRYLTLHRTVQRGVLKGSADYPRLIEVKLLTRFILNFTNSVMSSLSIIPLNTNSAIVIEWLTIDIYSSTDSIHA